MRTDGSGQAVLAPCRYGEDLGDSSLGTVVRIGILFFN